MASSKCLLFSHIHSYWSLCSFTGSSDGNSECDGMFCVECSHCRLPPQGNVPAKELQRRPLEMFMCSVLKRQGYGEGRLCAVVIFTSVGWRKGEEGNSWQGLALTLDIAKLLLWGGGGKPPEIACTTSLSGEMVVFWGFFYMLSWWCNYVKAMESHWLCQNSS